MQLCQLPMLTQGSRQGAGHPKSGERALCRGPYQGLHIYLRLSRTQSGPRVPHSSGFKTLNYSFFHENLTVLYFGGCPASPSTLSSQDASGRKETESESFPAGVRGGTPAVALKRQVSSGQLRTHGEDGRKGGSRWRNAGGSGPTLHYCKMKLGLAPENRGRPSLHCRGAGDQQVQERSGGSLGTQTRFRSWPSSSFEPAFACLRDGGNMAPGHGHGQRREHRCSVGTVPRWEGVSPRSSPLSAIWGLF